MIIAYWFYRFTKNNTFKNFWYYPTYLINIMGACQCHTDVSVQIGNQNAVKPGHHINLHKLTVFQNEQRVSVSKHIKTYHRHNNNLEMPISRKLEAPPLIVIITLF
jgi:hypothetical protein